MVCGIFMVLLSITAQQLFQMVGTDINVCIPGFHHVLVPISVKKKEVSDHMFPVSNFSPPKKPSFNHWISWNVFSHILSNSLEDEWFIYYFRVLDSTRIKSSIYSTWQSPSYGRICPSEILQPAVSQWLAVSSAFRPPWSSPPRSCLSSMECSQACICGRIMTWSSPPGTLSTFRTAPCTKS